MYTEHHLPPKLILIVTFSELHALYAAGALQAVGIRVYLHSLLTKSTTRARYKPKFLLLDPGQDANKDQNSTDQHSP